MKPSIRSKICLIGCTLLISKYLHSATYLRGGLGTYEQSPIIFTVNLLLTLASYPLVCKFNRTFKSQDSILHQIVLNQPFNTYLVPTCFQLPTLMHLGRQFLWFVARMLLFQDRIKKKQAKDEMSNHVPSQCLQQILD